LHLGLEPEATRMLRHRARPPGFRGTTGVGLVPPQTNRATRRQAPPPWKRVTASYSARRLHVDSSSATTLLRSSYAGPRRPGVGRGLRGSARQLQRGRGARRVGRDPRRRVDDRARRDASLDRASRAGDTWLFVDAPLVITNLTRQRLADKQVGQRYGRWWVSANSVNLSSPRQAGVRLSARLRK
jgi:hypothetical protein